MTYSERPTVLMTKLLTCPPPTAWCASVAYEADGPHDDAFDPCSMVCFGRIDSRDGAETTGEAPKAVPTLEELIPPHATIPPGKRYDHVILSLVTQGGHAIVVPCELHKYVLVIGSRAAVDARPVYATQSPHPYITLSHPDASPPLTSRVESSLSKLPGKPLFARLYRVYFNKPVVYPSLEVGDLSSDTCVFFPLAPPDMDKWARARVLVPPTEVRRAG
jgi:hypothetical protein